MKNVGEIHPRQHAHSSLNAESEGLRQRLMQLDELPPGGGGDFRMISWDEMERSVNLWWELMGHRQS